MLSESGDCRLRQKLYCPETGREYDFKDTARGFEIAPDQYVILSDEELDKAKPEKGHTIEITQFVDGRQIDPVYYQRTYYLGPEERGVKGYALLSETLADEHKVGIAKFVLRGKESLVAVRPHDGGLALHTLHFADEVLALHDQVKLPHRTKADAREIKMARQLIDALSGRFEPEKYRNEYADRLRELVEQKSEGKRVTLPSGPEPPPRTLNFMKALQASLREAKKGATADGHAAGSSTHHRRASRGGARRRRGTARRRAGATSRSRRRSRRAA